MNYLYRPEFMEFFGLRSMSPNAGPSSTADALKLSNEKTNTEDTDEPFTLVMKIFTLNLFHFL